MSLTRISEVAVEQMMELEKKYIIPAYVIIGRKEYDLLINDIKEHPTLIVEDGWKLLNMRVVLDFESASRITVTPEIGLRSNRLMQKAGLL